MLKLYSASSFCLPNKNRVGVAHGDGTNLEVVYNKHTSKMMVNGQMSFFFFMGGGGGGKGIVGWHHFPSHNHVCYVLLVYCSFLLVEISALF